MKVRILFIFIILIQILLSCEETDISLKQAEFFIKYFGNSSEDIGVDVKQTSDGGYILTGTVTNTDNENKDIAVIKTDKFGNLEWLDTLYFGGQFDDEAASIIECSDGDFLLLGT